MRRPSPLVLLISSVTGLAVVMWVVSFTAELSYIRVMPLLMPTMLTGGMIVASFFPVSFVFHRRERDLTLVFSGGFSLALVLVVPLWLFLTILVVTELTDELMSRRLIPRRFAFNIGQVAVGALTTKSLYWVLTGVWNLDRPQHSIEFIALVVCAVVDVAVNQGLVIVITALSLKQKVREVAAQSNTRALLIPSALDLSYAPLSLALLNFWPWFFPLLSLPPLVIRHGSWIASSRERDATHDVLTGLPNRSMLPIVFNEHIGAVKKKQAEMAVMLIDLDHFKEINDTLGHEVGDRLLCEVAHRLTKSVREGDTVARLGGDEFAVITPLTHLHGHSEALDLAARITSNLRQPFITADVHIDVQGSVGVALAPYHGTDLTKLMGHADVALYTAKMQRGCACMYDPEEDALAQRRLTLVAQLGEAISANQLDVVYEPMVQSGTNRPYAAQAVLRWHHPSEGIVLGETFFPWAQSSGVIVELSYYLLKQALSDAGRWAGQGSDLPVMVEFPARLLTDSALPTLLKSLLAESELSASTLIVAVSEQTLGRDPARMGAVLATLGHLGVRLHLQDYGSSSSNVEYLSTLHLHSLGLSPRFLPGAELDGAQVPLGQLCMHVGMTLGLQVNARAVSSARQAHDLQQWGCQVLSGPWVGEAMSGPDVLRWTSQGRAIDVTAAHPQRG